jgi:hypothetical protein
MLSQRRLLLAALTAAAVLGSFHAARATNVDVIAYPFTGADTSVEIFLDDTGGDIAVTLTVNDGVADLRGFFLNISDFSLFDGLQVKGDDVTGWQAEERGVINLHYGINLNGGGSPCPCDIGVALGTPGTGRDDLSATTFVLDATAPLSIENFVNELAGVRVTSAGSGDGAGLDLNDLKDVKDPKDDPEDEKGGSRGGSAKLVATIPEPGAQVPEPSPAFLVALGLGILGFRYRLRR